MADRIVAAEKAERTPDWRVWRLIREPELWQLVALSLNIDPHKVETNDDSWYGTPLVFYESQEFQDRLHVVCANAGRDGVPANPRSCMSFRTFAAWVHRFDWEAPLEMLAMADIGAMTNDNTRSDMRTVAAASKRTAAILDDQPNVDEELGIPSVRVDKQNDNAFTSMDGLTWDEITITFISIESVRVRARGKSETFTFDAMGFKHRTSHMAKPNECWKTFMRLAVVSTSTKTWNDVSRTHDLKKRISRLRHQLQLFFGIVGNPIAFRKSVGYQPAFNLTVEEHVIRNMRERHTNCADEDEGDNIRRMMSEVPGR